MLQYACEWCHRIKRSGDGWILGFASEKVGATSARREITIAAQWSERWARHPLAVHFCSDKHKQQFVRALFDGAPSARTQVRRRTASSAPECASSAANLGALLEADRGPARTSVSKQRSLRRQRVSRGTAVFSAPDAVRAHGLSIRVDDSLPVVRAPIEQDDLGYGGA